MLADYFRQVGASVTVVRHIHAQEMLKKKWDLLVLSPGPGRPEDFGISKTIGTAIDRKLPIFGVCLGVQAIGEYFGGQLGQLGHPAHGRPSRVQVRGGRLPVGGVQFHPESLMSLGGEVGLRIVENAFRLNVN